MSPHRWVCHSCQAINPAEATSCSACGFPAIATAREIESVEDGSPIPASAEQGGFFSLPLPQIAAILIGIGTACIGLALIHFSKSFDVSLIGFGVVALGLSILWLVGFIRINIKLPPALKKFVVNALLLTSPAWATFSALGLLYFIEKHPTFRYLFPLPFVVFAIVLIAPLPIWRMKEHLAVKILLSLVYCLASAIFIFMFGWGVMIWFNPNHH